MTYAAAPTRYDTMTYRRSGRSGLKLPAISLGLWHNFGGDSVFETMREMCRTAFDLGITHFDLANNYGPPAGSAEENFGQILKTDFQGLRDELIVSTKAGYNMWPGPYGEWGSRKYLLSSLDQSLKRMGLDYVDIFYSHRVDPDTPLEETMGALDAAVRQGKALYAGISSYNSQRTAEAAEILRELGTPCLIHQPSYSMLNRWIEGDRLLDTLEEEGIGCIVFSPLAQGMLTSKYLKGVPAGSRAKAGKSFKMEFLSEETVAHVSALNDIAKARGQSLAQMAIAWVLRDPRMTSALIGASRPEQIREIVGALKNTEFSKKELKDIDRYAEDAGINLWVKSSKS
jgi:L-glyceraldehyde 3-phosphate reductase